LQTLRKNTGSYIVIIHYDELIAQRPLFMQWFSIGTVIKLTVPVVLVAVVKSSLEAILVLTLLHCIQNISATFLSTNQTWTDCHLNIFGSLW
jgi:hypothetical protein